MPDRGEVRSAVLTFQLLGFSCTRRVVCTNKRDKRIARIAGEQDDARALQFARRNQKLAAHSIPQPRSLGALLEGVVRVDDTSGSPYGRSALARASSRSRSVCRSTHRQKRAARCGRSSESRARSRRAPRREAARLLKFQRGRRCTSLYLPGCVEIDHACGAPSPVHLRRRRVKRASAAGAAVSLPNRFRGNAVRS